MNPCPIKTSWRCPWRRRRIGSNKKKWCWRRQKNDNIKSDDKFLSLLSTSSYFHWSRHRFFVDFDVVVFQFRHNLFHRFRRCCFLSFWMSSIFHPFFADFDVVVYSSLFLFGVAGMPSSLRPKFCLVSVWFRSSSVVRQSGCSDTRDTRRRWRMKRECRLWLNSLCGNVSGVAATVRCKWRLFVSDFFLAHLLDRRSLPTKLRPTGIDIFHRTFLRTYALNFVSANFRIHKSSYRQIFVVAILRPWKSARNFHKRKSLYRQIFVVTDLHLRKFVCKSSSADPGPQIFIHKSTSAEHRLSLWRLPKVQKPSCWRGGERSAAR